MVESCRTGLRRIEDDDKALLASGDLSGSLQSFPLLVAFKSNSSTKLKPVEEEFSLLSRNNFVCSSTAFDCASKFDYGE